MLPLPPAIPPTRAIANVVAGSMEEMSAGIMEITSAAHTVSEKAIETREQIVELDKLIDTFKLS